MFLKFLHHAVRVYSTGPFVLAVFLFLPISASATDPHHPSWQASGHLKNLHHNTRSLLTRRPYHGNLTRARVELQGEFPFDKPAPGASTKRALRARLDYDQELRLGTFLRSAEYLRLGLAEPDAHFALEQTISSGTDALYRHRLYRGWLELQEGGWQLRFGRQRIAWGTGKLWNPTDFLNPYQPTSVERSERRGVDALVLRRGLSALGTAEFVYTFAPDWTQSDLVGRARGHAGEADLSVSGGKVAGSTFSFTSAADVSAVVFGGNLNAELGYTDLKVRTPFWKFLGGYEYSFSADPPWRWLKDAWVVAEYLHSGSGHLDKRRYDRRVLLTGREVALARDYAGFGFRKELHPLVEIELYQITNLSDKSHFVNPSISWNALKDLHLLAGLQRFGGIPASEFGALPNILYFQGQYFF